MTRSFRLSALVTVAGLALGSAQDARASFDVTTSISSSTVNGVAVASPMAFSVGTANITLTNFTSLANSGSSIPAEAVTLTGAYSSSATIVITEVITVTNPTVTGVTGTFGEIATYALGSNGLINTSVAFDNSPNPQLIGGTSFTASNAQATSTQFNQAVNNAAISALITASAVPEPASVAMLGLGLAGLGGFAARRRARSAK